TRKILEQGCEQFDTDQLSAIEHITIQKLAADSIGHPIEVPHLIKEQITKSIMNKRVVVELHGFREVCLTAADDRRPGIYHTAKTFHLRRIWLRNVVLAPLKGKNHQIALRLQFANFCSEIIKVTGRRTGMVGGGNIRLADVRHVAAQECDSVSMYIKQGGLESILQIRAASEMRDVMGSINR